VRKEGFTLIECIVAISILTVGILGIAGMLTIGTRLVRTGIKSFTAVQVARNRMETLYALDSLTKGGLAGDCPGPPGIECSWEIIQDAPGLLRFKVVTSWKEGDDMKSFVIEALRYKRT